MDAQTQQKQQQQQLATQAAQLLLNGSEGSIPGAGMGDIDPQVVEQVIQVRATHWLCADTETACSLSLVPDRL